ncbi:MAG: hypothetical protein JXB42_01490 [Deltaproteobacteria bacterium]|nr:hypothetical protein [Deltaproteobacteria bacterium]
MSGFLIFYIHWHTIVDNNVFGWTGLRYLEEWTRIAKAFDITPAYFDIVALLALESK